MINIILKIIMQAPQQDYSRFTLRLKDPNMHEPFWEFTIDEILFTMPYFLILAVVYTIASVFEFEDKSFIIVSVVALLLYIAVHILGQKRKKYHVYGMLMLFLTRQSLILITQIFYINYTDQIQHDLALRASYSK